jgi:hypothetical protein
MRRQVQEVPQELPSAQLYLEDIETITDILIDEVRQAFEARLNELRTESTREDSLPQLQATIFYRTGGDEMDTVDDLVAQGRSVTDLEIEVNGRCDQLIFHDTWWLRIAKEGQPYLSHYASYDDDVVWSVHGKVRAIFDKRRMVLKNFGHDVSLPPTWITTASALLGVVLLGSRRPGLQILGAAIFALPISFGAIVYMLNSTPNRVFLVRSHVKSRDRAESRRKYIINAAIFVLGVLVKTVLDYLTKRYLK